MSKYFLKIQERENYCVCSVLQAIFQSEGINFSQDDIAVRLNPTNEGFSISDDKIKLFFRSKGFQYIDFHHNETPFNEPDMLLEEMKENHGVVGINSHAYLLNNFDYPILNLIDPETGEAVERSMSELFGNGKKIRFGLVKKLE